MTRQQSTNLEEHEPNTVASLLKQYLQTFWKICLPKSFGLTLKRLVGEAQKVRKWRNSSPYWNNCQNVTVLVSWLVVHMDHVIMKDLDTKMNIQNISIMLSPVVQIISGALLCFSHVCKGSLEIWHQSKRWNLITDLTWPLCLHYHRPRREPGGRSENRSFFWIAYINICRGE